MRIVIFVGSLGTGGAERVAVWLAGALQSHGHVVSVLTLAPTGQDAYPISDGVDRASIDSFGAHRGVLAKLWATLTRILRLRRYLRARKADAVVAFMTQESVMAILATRGTSVRCIVSERNAPWHRSAPTVWGWGRRLFYRRADAVVAQTEAVADWLIRMTGTKNTTIIPNAVISTTMGNDVVVSPDAAVLPSRKVLLAVGSKPHQKGFDILVDVFHELADELADWDLVILGLEAEGTRQTPQTRELVKDIEKRGLSRRVYLPGRVGNMQDWYARATMFVLSSRFEGMPNALIEAMAAGIAAIAFDCPTGPGELIADGENGILVPPADRDGLLAAVRNLACDHALRATIATRARDICITHEPTRIASLWEGAITGATKADAPEHPEDRRRTV